MAPGPGAYSGLEPNIKKPNVLHVHLITNLSWPDEDKFLNYTIPPETLWPWCDYWKEPQHLMFQLANCCFSIAYASPCSKKGVLFMHCWLILGLMLFSTWAWNVICAPDVFTWNFAFMLLNMAHVFHILYQLRPVKFDEELEEVYHTLFYPFKVSRLQFKRMVSSEFAQIMSLHAGEAYAMQNLTRTDRLGLLLSGKVSIVATSSCRYLYWQRSSLEYLFVKEPYLATVLTTLIARDITTKLYAMNNKIVTAKGSHLDIRLPSITSSLTSGGEYKSPVRIRNKNSGPMSPDSFLSDRSRDKYKDNNDYSSPNGRAGEMEPLTELPSNDDLTSNDVESWLENSSKYHSCEIVDSY